jgi:uncharacterized protein
MSGGVARVPGVSREEVQPAVAADFRTGVPAIVVAAALAGPLALGSLGQLPPQLAAELGPVALAALRGFFACGGTRCHLVPLAAGEPGAALRRALELADEAEDADLIAAPELVVNHRPDAPGGPALLVKQQRLLLEHGLRRGRFVILDAPMRVALRPDEHVAAVERHAAALIDAPGAENGALYFPWLRAGQGGDGFVPPSGHVAGMFAATDALRGVHKAPANEPLREVVDLELRVDAASQSGPLAAVNCLRALPGRGVRVWGARTLASAVGSRHISVRRLLLTLGRWLERRHDEFNFEPNDAGLWARILRALHAELGELHRRGAFLGQTPQDAYYVRCDAETNPPELRAAGIVCAEIGVAPVTPRSFIVLRLSYTTQGITVAT